MGSTAHRPVTRSTDRGIQDQISASLSAGTCPSREIQVQVTNNLFEVSFVLKLPEP
ncbi:predicted protein [Sclerotinia sclerotiorum 1980 UF-70]|uniref:Uncharacterized protein n=1 Tax=Sclerotinia sclerotiorum (strain ATCC 18683 / 1980 / Ss-1) TaxID=665079 RepID=A7EVS1_SCLS1|nr:predicted protein [Sclerotinia sclerotiorum 1980 UF-70]EDN93563.1 predicted protein [Sclerotinia sclerotiorum 1980 UF-70]